MRAELVNKKTEEVVYYYNIQEKKPTFTNETVHQRICQTGINLLLQGTNLNESSKFCKDQLVCLKPDQPGFHAAFVQTLERGKVSQFSLRSFEWKYY